MISAETRRNFNDFNDMYRELNLEGEGDIQDMVVDRVTSEPELDHRRLDDVLRWRDGDHYLEAEGYEFDGDDDGYGYGYDSDDSGYEFDLGYGLDDDVFSHRSSDPGYGSDYDVNDDYDDDVSDIDD